MAHLRDFLQALGCATGSRNGPSAPRALDSALRRRFIAPPLAGAAYDGAMKRKLPGTGRTRLYPWCRGGASALWSRRLGE